MKREKQKWKEKIEKFVYKISFEIKKKTENQKLVVN